MSSKMKHANKKVLKIENEETSVQSGRNDCAGWTGIGEALELQPCPEQPVLHCTTDMIEC
jgi:hypothetical protein